MRRLWLALCLFACGTPPRAKPPGPDDVGDLHAPPRGVAFCPPIAKLAGYWASELFPACQPPPFDPALTYCAGQRCDAPCKRDGIAFTYDENKHYLGNDRGERCIYAKGLLLVCNEHSVERDAKDRLTSIDKQPVQYDPQGRVTGIGNALVEYDNAGRLAKAGPWTMRWNGQGQVESATDGGVEIEYSYDTQGRMIREKTTARVQDESTPPTFHAIIYDGARVKEERGSDNRAIPYEYCP